MTLQTYYEQCVADNLGKYARQRAVAFDTLRWAGGAPFELHKAARQSVDPRVINEIRVANVLDLRLYTLATQLYHQRSEELSPDRPRTHLK